MLFWSLVGLICGFKFKSVRTQCWGVAPLCFIASLITLNHWYNWEINTPNFVCSECGTKQIYVKGHRGGRTEYKGIKYDVAKPYSMLEPNQEGKFVNINSDEIGRAHV